MIRKIKEFFKKILDFIFIVLKRRNLLLEIDLDEYSEFLKI